MRWRRVLSPTSKQIWRESQRCVQDLNTNKPTSVIKVKIDHVTHLGNIAIVSVLDTTWPNSGG
jgi:hypothetical protein